MKCDYCGEEHAELLWNSMKGSYCSLWCADSARRGIKYRKPKLGKVTFSALPQKIGSKSS